MKTINGPSIYQNHLAGGHCYMATKLYSHGLVSSEESGVSGDIPKKFFRNF